MIKFGIGLFKALFFTAGPKYSWKKATLVITLSSTVFLSLIVCFRLGGIAVSSLSPSQSAPRVEGIVQIGLQTHPQAGSTFSTLPAGYLTEALDLSIDSPPLFSKFDVAEGERRLLASHVIAEAKLKKLRPNLLAVDYVLRTPWAYLGDYTNTAVDREGFLFPFAPFFSPRNLPEIYLGEHAPCSPWGDRIKEEHLKLAYTIMGALPREDIVRIDLSHYLAPTAGKREIVVTLRDNVLLRLAAKNCVQQLTHYSILKGSVLKNGAQKMMIDLRIPDVAYIQRLSDGT